MPGLLIGARYTRLSHTGEYPTGPSASSFPGICRETQPWHLSTWRDGRRERVSHCGRAVPGMADTTYRNARFWCLIRPFPDGSRGRIRDQSNAVSLTGETIRVHLPNMHGNHYRGFHFMGQQNLESVLKAAGNTV